MLNAVANIAKCECRGCLGHWKYAQQTSLTLTYQLVDIK